MSLRGGAYFAGIRQVASGDDPAGRGHRRPARGAVVPALVARSRRNQGAAHPRRGGEDQALVTYELYSDEIHDPTNTAYRGRRRSSMVGDPLSPGAGAFPFVRG